MRGLHSALDAAGPQAGRIEDLWWIFFWVCTAVFVLVCLLYDRLAHGRVHPAFLWGGVGLLISMPARIAISRTDTWLRFAQWLTG